MSASGAGRSVWLPTLLQPVGVLVVVALGLIRFERYPAGATGEAALLVGIGLVTVPGLVAVVIDAVVASRHGAVTPVDLPAGVRRKALGATVLQALIALWDETPVLRRHRSADVVDRITRWGFLQSGVSVATFVVLLVLPVAEDWAVLALLPVLGVMGVWAMGLVGGLGWLACALVVAGVRPGETRRRHPSGVTRSLLVCLGVGLLGLAAVAPAFVGEGVSGAGDVALTWQTVRRVAVVTAIAGLVGTAVLLPVAARGARDRAATA